MTSPDPDLLIRAAVCYQRVGLIAEAARCFREAGSFRRAADMHERLGHYRDAALDYAYAGHEDLAAWILVHQIGEPAAARDQLARPSLVGGTRTAILPLRRRLVEARCDVAEGRRATAALAALDEACASLEETTVLPDLYVEAWAVALGEAMHREDQVALVFAAAIRGNRAGAEQRWRSWMAAALHSPLILPRPAQAG